MKVNEVMTREAECTRPDAKVQEAAERMRALNVGSLPVCENDRLVGMVTDRDITVRSTSEGCDPWTVSVREAMTPEIVYCFESDDVDSAVRLMKQRQVRRLAVLNDNKRLVGILSLGDIAVKCGDEQLSGEALEEVSEPAAPVR